MPEQPRGERTCFAYFVCTPQRYGAPRPRLAHPGGSGMIDTALHARQYRTRGSSE